MSTTRPSFPARLPSGMPQTGAKTPVLSQAAAAGSAKATGAAFSAGIGMDSATVRARMVQLLAQGGIRDERVLAAMNRIERHRFVDTALAPQAYEDTSLPIGLSQTISKPNVVARMVALLREKAALDSQGKMGRVLEIGSGCGYQAAILSQLCKEVYSIERLRGLYDKALLNVRHLAAPNLHLLLGDGMLGVPAGAPYAGIIAAAGGEAIPQAWIDQLAIGGRIVAPIVMTDQATPRQALMVLDKNPDGMKQTVLESVLFVPLKSGTA
jgi:protein-L-isoaspartate(D-aspartate) O-methyltransferase